MARCTEENVVTIIQRCVSILKSPMMQDKEMKKFYLKYLVHLVGDIHQPVFLQVDTKIMVVVRFLLNLKVEKVVM